ncbi:hypothetical protein FJ426_00145 [Mesorhizobium sp. B2-6-4]|nr:MULTISPECIES: hypothetical protein [unclassified Mesorhizobium]TPJ56078.1 hypothetical protein FJ426_00145 [Mesorhizobium sp. B2-6-4]TPM89565.1 hypothetical protein FJ966_29035 [Mesorhizobium sp. B2-1-5]
MNDTTTPPKKGGTGRKDRLAEQLRANLLKRKAQSRSRRAGDADKQRTGEADKHRAGHIGRQHADDADKRRAGEPDEPDKRPDGLGAAKEIQKD